MTVDDLHTYYVLAGDEAVLVHNCKRGLNLNSNKAKSKFGIYEIHIKGKLRKIGKADMNRVTKSSGRPTRLHQQVRKLEKMYGKRNVSGKIVNPLGQVTTKQAKLAENARLQRYYDATGRVPFGNRRSFRPS